MNASPTMTADRASTMRMVNRSISERAGSNALASNHGAWSSSGTHIDCTASRLTARSKASANARAGGDGEAAMGIP